MTAQPELQATTGSGIEVRGIDSVTAAVTDLPDVLDAPSALLLYAQLGQLLTRPQVPDAAPRPASLPHHRQTSPGTSVAGSLPARPPTARAAANEWDAVIMTRTAFQRVSLSPEAEAAYINYEVMQMRAELEAVKNSEQDN